MKQGNRLHIECPHCNFKFNPEDIAHTLNNGNFKCPVCGKKIPSSSEDQFQSSVSLTPQSKYIILVLIILGIAAALTVFHFSKSTDKIISTVNPVAPKITEPPSNPPPSPAIATPDTPKPLETIPEPQAPQASPKPDKMQIVERIAAMYHASHSYTMEGGFVCLDMAIDVWNQLRTYGIEAKIMGGNIHENITAWNYRQLAMEGNHAWVVATISPNEKVAIETTAGTVIKQGTTEAAPYFKGIAFDDPAQVKRFELLRKAATGNCRDAINLVNDWNENVSGKQLRPEVIIAKKSRIEQRKQDCERAREYLKEFESKAIFY